MGLTWTIAVTVLAATFLCIAPHSAHGAGDVKCDSSNSKPSADAGGSSLILSDVAYVQLDGRASQDADGDDLTFSWSILSIPGESSLKPDAISEKTARPFFRPDAAGVFKVRLTVTDECGHSDTADQTVTFKSLGDGNCFYNLSPEANAGADFVSTGLDEFTLDGSKSYDAECRHYYCKLQYRWTLFSSPPDSVMTTRHIKNRDEDVATFVPDIAGDYVFTLAVSDSCGTVSDDVTVSVECPANEVEARGGPDRVTHVDQDVVLDGYTSGYNNRHADGLTYQWTLASSPSGSELDTSDIANGDSSRPHFTPDAEGTYEFRVDVKDSCSEASDWTRVIAVSRGTPTNDVCGRNSAPWIEATSRFASRLNVETPLFAQAGDGDWDLLTYRWTLVSKPQRSELEGESITNKESGRATFVPDAAGVFVFQLDVADQCKSVSRQVTVRVDCNSPPTAEAGEDVDSSIGTYTQLDGTGSTDEDEDSLDYYWEYVSGPFNATETPFEFHDGVNNTAKVAFIPSKNGKYAFKLTVADACSSSEDYVVVTIHGYNVLPGNTTNCCVTHDSASCTDKTISTCVCVGPKDTDADNATTTQVGVGDSYCCSENGLWDLWCVMAAAQCGGCDTKDSEQFHLLAAAPKTPTHTHHRGGYTSGNLMESEVTNCLRNVASTADLSEDCMVAGVVFGSQCKHDIRQYCSHLLRASSQLMSQATADPFHVPSGLHTQTAPLPLVLTAAAGLVLVAVVILAVRRMRLRQ